MTLKPILLRRTYGYKILWERLRLLRNSCVDGFTHTRREITPEEQEIYVQNFPETVRHYLYIDEHGVVVAFSRLEHQDDGFIYPTYGVDPAHRGKRYAWQVVKHAMLAAGGPLRGDLFVTNKAIMMVDFTLGWRPVGEPVDGVLSVEAPWPPPFVGDPTPEASAEACRLAAQYDE